ncbi:LysR family transcriptional regulator [Brenneria corticis]|uniref:Transcriptional regulator n=1 Tax=Brenneria corticis TaxID=2173106 RepID=A0A2U1TLL2_9GAMM|nr:LysR family transcriptional regulator [Brenneria sp. CFCC 11842]PWC10291.1 transcriptional regulator [Brenneria sp. CFCC 11842]
MSTNQTTALLGEMTVFAKVVETGSFSETARQLGATPSAISRSVARLEKALGTRLLQRTTRKLRLSESGREVFERCVDLVNAAQAVMSVSDRFNIEPQGLVRVSVPKAVGRFVIHPHLADFLACYPKVDVQLLLKDRYVDLIDEQVDLAIRITNRPSPGLMGRRLIDIDHMLCATPKYLAKFGTPTHPQDLKKHNCICLGEEPGDSRWKFRQGNKSVTVGVHGRYAVNHTGARLDAVLHDLGIGSLPYFTARHALQQGHIVQVLPDWIFKTNYCGEAWVLYPPTRHLPPKLSAFINFMAGRLSQEPTLGKPHKLNSPPAKSSPYESPEAET